MKNAEDFSFYYFNKLGFLALIKLDLLPTNQNLSISFFTDLHRTIELTWSFFSKLILKEYKAFIYIQKHYLDSSRFLLYVLLSCFHSPNFGFAVLIPQLLSLKNKLVKFDNIHYFVHFIKFSFNFYLFMFKDFSHSNSSKLLIRFITFSVAFSIKPCNCRLSPSTFLLSFFY